MKGQKLIKVYLVGGGSGGHVTPIVALAKSIKAKKLPWQISYVGAKDDLVGQKLIRRNSELFFDLQFLQSGKYSRFTNEKKGLNLKKWSKHIPQFSKAGIGFIQSLILIGRNRPDLIFSKGGYPALGPALAAVIWRVPLVIHDSDSVVGLTHRLVYNWARVRLSGVPVNREGVQYVGVPINAKIKKSPIESLKKRLAKKYKFPPDVDLILVTGGSGGARNLNQALITAIDQVKLKPKTHFLLITGLKNYQDTVEWGKAVRRKKKLTIIDFSDDFVDLMRIAEIVISRAGATSLAEAAAASKPTIIVPNPLLPGNHQTKNARIFKNAEAALIVPDNGNRVNQRLFIEAINNLVGSKKRRKELSVAIGKLAATDAIEKIIVAINKIVVAKQRRKLPNRRQPIASQTSQRSYLPNKSLSVDYVGSVSRLVNFERKKKRIFRIKLLLSATLLGLMFVFYKTTYVEKIEVIVEEHQAHLIRQSTLQKLETDANHILHNQSYFNRIFNQPVQLINRHLSESDYVDSSRVDYKFWETSARIIITPKEIMGIVQSGQHRQLVAIDGVAMIDQEQILKNNKDQLLIQTSIDIPKLISDEQPLLTKTEASFIKQAVDYLNSRQAKVVRVEIENNKYQINLWIEGYPEIKIIALLMEDPLKQAIAIVESLQEFEQDEDGNLPTEYIDVRSVKKVIWK